jgi:isopenicillin N synthase-like dioxygenase
MFAHVRQLFDLPLSEKQKLAANLSPLHRGYTGVGGSHNCVPQDSCVVGPDLKESFLLGKPCWGLSHGSSMQAAQHTLSSNSQQQGSGCTLQAVAARALSAPLARNTTSILNTNVC